VLVPVEPTPVLKGLACSGLFDEPNDDKICLALFREVPYRRLATARIEIVRLVMAKSGIKSPVKFRISLAVTSLQILNQMKM